MRLRDGAPQGQCGGRPFAQTTARLPVGSGSSPAGCRSREKARDRGLRGGGRAGRRESVR